MRLRRSPAAQLSGVFLVALVLRVYKFSQSIAFRADQASDLFIARESLSGTLHPHVGPFLSVAGFQTPPTYYYLLSFLLAALRTPEGVTAGFLLLNIAAMALLYRVAAALVDRQTGLLSAFLFCVSSVMVSQSRQMWQPHPLTFLVLLALSLLVDARRKNSIFLLFLSSAVYAAGISVYPSPILLLPFMLYACSRFFSDKRHVSAIPSFFAGCAVIALSAIPWFLPFVSYERSHGFPTARSLWGPSFGLPSIALMPGIILQYVSGLFSDLTGLRLTIPATLSVIVLSVYAYRRVFRSGYFHERFRQLGDAIALPVVCSGLPMMIFFRGPGDSYRVHVLIPFVFLFLGAALRYLSLHRRSAVRVTGLVVLCAYTAGNIMMIRSQFWSDRIPEISAAKSAVASMRTLSETYAVRSEDMTLLAYRPDSYSNYPVFPYLYFLTEQTNYKPKMVPQGNDVDRTRLDQPDTPYVFLVCSGYSDAAFLENNCIGFFLEGHPQYRAVTRVKLADGSELALFGTRKPDYTHDR